MRWNTEAGECQIYLDVDCSQFTYDTAPSSGILAAVDRANVALADPQYNNPLDQGDTSTNHLLTDFS